MISTGILPVSFNIDVSNVLLMRIYVETSGQSHAADTIGIVNARVERRN
jgi:hypothetical protein